VANDEVGKLAGSTQRYGEGRCTGDFDWPTRPLINAMKELQREQQEQAGAAVKQ
jgi:hypothetical protein